MVEFIQSLADQNPSLMWLLISLGFLSISLVAHRPLLLAMGGAGVGTSIISLSMPVLSQQFLVWGLLSIAIALLLRNFVPNPSPALKHDATAQVATSILPQEMGKVLYEGALWNARCQISDVYLAEGDTVSVVARQGNTLIVTPIPAQFDTLGKPQD
ncbi:MAG: NfeD family protein [Cyanobacteria bacterium J06635_15]